MRIYAGDSTMNRTESSVGAQAGLLIPGDTCWRIETADRMSVIVDGADYFRHLRAALHAAREAIYLVGWDLDLRLEMIPGESDAEGKAPDGLPNRLGDFLQHIVDAAPEVSLHLLKWDKAMLVQLTMQASETIELKLSSDRIHFALDSHHPTGATHHQKVVVVDDRVAFCGGIDVTGGRWDTTEHRSDDPRRHYPGGAPSKPWHDVTTALSGPVAQALGDLARTRWSAATGESLDAPDAQGDPWPPELGVELRDVSVGIARTKPDYHDEDGIHEIEHLYLAAIHAARDTIYLESQYFASGTLCKALEARLEESQGPEIVVVNPDRAEGFAQHQAMDTARARMIERLHEAQARGGGGPRFRIFHPANDAGEAIYVHAKVLVVDDRLVRIGSSNVNSRSMGFDTECDIAVETASEAQRQFALDLRHRLLAEHMGTSADAVAEAVRSTGSVCGAIDRLNGKTARRLVPIEDVPANAVRRELGERILFDERTFPRNLPRPLRTVPHAVSRAMAPYQFETVAAGAVLLGIAAVGVGVWAGIRLARQRADERDAPFPAPAVITGRAEPRGPSETALVKKPIVPRP